MKIYLGPAGIPISLKRKSTLGSIEYLHQLGLNAMEVEFVRGVKMSKEVAKKVGKMAKRFGIRLSLIHTSEPTRPRLISYAVFCLKKKKK